MTKAENDKNNSGLNQDDMEEMPTVNLTDESGRSLQCYVEHSLQVEDAVNRQKLATALNIQSYALKRWNN